MAFWIFKIAEQELYPDEPGAKYVYDNTHSVKVKQGDGFLYLDKTKGYAFTAFGIVKRVTKRNPTATEAARARSVRVVYTAQLGDVAWFTEPLSISPDTKQGRKNRAQLGITDVNLLGWSQSMPSLSKAMFAAIVDQVELSGFMPTIPGEDFSVPDAWGNSKVRPAMKGFTTAVMNRSNGTCIVCGTGLKGIVEAAHLSPYATDVKNRANPANGVGLCKYCHRALDLRIIAITREGELLKAPGMTDPVALFHFDRLTSEGRRPLLSGVGSHFLDQTVERFEAYRNNN